MTIIPFNRPDGDSASTGRGHPATRRALSILRTKLRDRAIERALRRDFRKMLDLDDAILRDIGVTRGDVIWAASLPLSVDSRSAMEDRRAGRDMAA